LPVDALIGSTGFVGSEIGIQHEFGAKLNSKTISSAAGQHFGTIVCAAAPGSMLEANKLPERDHQRIDQLIGQLSTIKADRFVLISTIAVLDSFKAEDEASATFETKTPYGVNRRRLEEFVADHFEGSLVVRLPALFGDGLKKNFLFDLLNPIPSMLTGEKLTGLKSGLPDDLASVAEAAYGWDEMLSLFVLDRGLLERSGHRADLDAAVTALGASAVLFTNPESRFQFYDMSRLWADIQLGLDHDLNTLHLAPAPISAGEIYEALRAQPMPASGARVHAEDMRTAHANLWGKTGPYGATGDEIIDGIRALFARKANAGKPA
jgi:hypothetical protein